MLAGRGLPYGESVTYWPLAEMVKAAARISDDDPLDEAIEKLRQCCQDEVVADLLGLAVGRARGSRRRAQPAGDRLGRARVGVEQLAEAQPLVLVFEDIHWAEEPLLELIEHLDRWVREPPLLIVCLARLELLDVRPELGRAGACARPRSSSSRSARDRQRGARRRAPRASGHARPRADAATVLDKTEGNPLFVEETVRMVAEQGRRQRPRASRTRSRR